MKITVKIALSVLLIIGCVCSAKPQACDGVDNDIAKSCIKTSSALGSYNGIYDSNSTALGTTNSIFGKHSIAVGSNNIVYGIGSAAIGTTNTTLSATNSSSIAFAIGNNNTSSSNLSFAIGDNNTSASNSSFAIGDHNTSDNTYSFTIGRNNQSHASTSYAIGYSNTNTNSANGSVAIGSHITNNSGHCISIGEQLSNNMGGIMMGMNGHASNHKPTLYISKTTGLNETGKIGIGNVTSPSAKLHIKADSDEKADLMLEATGTSAIYFKNKNNSISLTGNIMTLSAGGFSYTDGNVAIGTMPNNDYKLAVKGVIRSEEVVVELMTSWPDYVFASDYSLPKLNEVKAFVNENGHLPGLPSASQVSENGLGLGEINAKLLEKIEELTLYIIEQEERIQKLEEKLNACH